MKILNIAMRTCFTEGYSYQDNLLTGYQQKMGHEVTILTSTATRDKDGKPAIAPVGTSFLSNGVKLVRIHPGNTLRQLLGYWPRVKSIINDEKPDFIIVHGLPSFVPLQAISYKKRHPGVCLVADSHQDERNCKLDGFPFAALMSLWRFCWKRWSPHFSHIYGVTSWRTDFALRHYGIPKEKLDTLIMGVDIDRLPANREEVRNEVRKELGCDDRMFVFVSGGKLDAKKHVIEAMKAFMKCDDPNLLLLLFGSIAPDINDEFHSILKQDARIKYIGFINSKIVHRYFIASDFGLFPGRHSVLWEEAAGCGLPCLYSQYTDHDHLQVCGNCIQLPRDAETDAIAEVIMRVVSDKGFYEDLKRNAIKAAPVFSYQVIAQKSLNK